ncbi:MAG: FtsX-like permease family protein [Dehalococcoidales bacterium]
MNKLQRKLFRDLGASRGLFLAVASVIFLGVTFFGASFMAFQNLSDSYDFTYEELRFADFTVKVIEAPSQTVASLEAIPGVAAVTGRLNTDIRLTFTADGTKSLLARVISLPSGNRPAVNDVKVEEGSYLPADDENALLVEKSFAEHHGLKPGDTLLLGPGGQEISFTVAGIVTSPEYIWPAKSRQEILASPETFGVVFVADDAVPQLLGRPLINEFAITVTAAADSDAVIVAVEEELAPYQVLDLVTREDQPSNAALSLDLQEFGELAEVFPLLFLTMGALATYILLTRIVYNQRTQIGLMRAVGYPRRRILAHYLSFSLVIGLAGSVAGVIAGLLLSGAVTKLYISILGLPFTQTEIHWLALEEGIFIGLLPTLIAGILPALAASRLNPATAMRTPPPPTGRKLLLERVFPFFRGLSTIWKIPLRNIFRKRGRSLYTIIGVAVGVSLILVSASFLDSLESLLSLQYDKIQKYDAQVLFASPQPARLADTVQGWDEVNEAQPVLYVPTRLEHGGSTYSTQTVGLLAESDLFGLYLSSGERVRVGPEGILLAEGLKAVLDINTGDTVTLRSSAGTLDLAVAGFVKQPMGSLGYISLEQAQQLAGGQDVIGGLMLAVEPQYLDTIREKAFEIPATGSVELTRETQQQIDELLGFFGAFMWVMLGFGAALALAIVFTTVTVNILERRREVATMRTLGESKGKIVAMLTTENLLLGALGLIPGLPLGYGLAAYFFTLFQTDIFSFELVIFTRTYLLAIGLVILIVLLSQIPGIRQLNRIDLARVIKEQET